jgi:myo-inositol-1(or 4)-monophosphatase
MKPPELPNVDSEFDELLHVALLAACAGGDKLIEWRGKFATREKSPADLVTDADVASQRAIASVVAENFPDHAFLGEENPGAIGELLGEAVCWVVDPLDGTTNYVHGFPAFSVSVAAVVEGEIVVGVILDPLRDQVYSAVKNGGSWCNGQRIHTSDTKHLGDALVALSLPPQSDGQSPDVLDFVSLVGRVRAIRRIGSAALNLAYVAQGVLDGHWARVIHPWDVAAGVLLVREAGGEVSGSDGLPFELEHPHFAAAATKPLHAELVDALGQSGGGQPAAE